MLIDCDPGIDDALAILLAFASPEVRLVGLNTSFGNASVEQTTQNAEGLLALAGVSSVPIAPGASRSLAGVAAQCVAHIHGRDGMGDCGCLPSVPRAGDSSSKAALQLLELSERYRGELVVLTLGPLTNLALAISLDPSLADRVAQLVIMGGNATVPGNATPAAEANILADPIAADRVFGEPWRRCTMIGLDVTQRAILGLPALDALSSSGSHASYLSKALGRYAAFYKRANGIDGVLLHDPTAMAYLFCPELFKTRAWPLRVQTSGIGTGKVWPSMGDTDDDDPREWAGRPAVEVCVDIDEKELVDRITERLSCGPKSRDGH